MTKRWTISWILGAGLLGAAVWVSVGGAQPETVPAEPRPQTVRLADVEPGAGEGIALRWSGVLRATDRATLSFPVSARLAERSVEIGDRVAEGDVIARLDDRQLENARNAAAARRREAETQLEQALRDRDRVVRLAERKAATPQERERVETAVEAGAASRDAALAALGEAERLLGETLLRAPFDGTVTGVSAEPGETLGSGDTVVELSGEGGFEVEIHLPETLLVELDEGAPVDVLLPLVDDHRVRGEVRRIARAAASGGLFPVVVSLSEVGEAGPRLLAGMSAEVELSPRRRSGVTVPLAAVLNPGTREPHVFRVAGDRVERVPIEVERLVGDRVVVRGALGARDRVVVTGQTRLLDGDRVEAER